MSCCGNPWSPGPGPSTHCVCGNFEEPEIPDLGQCSPYREKRDCEAPSRPPAPCNDPNAYVEYDPSQTPPFIIVTTIHDENCDPILDEEGAPILGQY